MSKRKINITISIPDNDFIQNNVENTLNNILGSSIIDFRVFPNTEHLKENETFKKLVKAKRDAGLQLDRFINDNR